MLSKDLIKEVILEQQQYALPKDYIKRDIHNKIKELISNDLVIIITGLRRVGKSVLLRNIQKEYLQSDYYLNFDDDRLINFRVEDFQNLFEVFLELFGEQKTFFFDEIQNIKGWERFVRRLYEQGNKVYITGSNASMLSIEMGTHLTGRNIPVTVYPFSFKEFINYKHLDLSEKGVLTTKQKAQVSALFSEYMKSGGIPEYIRNKQADYIHALYDNIIYRDIIVRYNLSSPKNIKELVFYAASNIGKYTTFSAIRKLLRIGSTTTVSKYFQYLEDSYLLFLLNQFDFSVKRQLMLEKKLYFIDHGMAHLVGFRNSEDKGRILENIVFLELLRRNNDIFVHKGKKECDFIIRKQNAISTAIQVCKYFDNDITKDREYAGLLEALETYKLSKGYIITDNTEYQETLLHNNKKYLIQVIPFWKFAVSTEIL